MRNTDLKSPGFWFIGLILILALALTSEVWAQPGGMGGMDGMGGPMGGGEVLGGGGQKRHAPPRFDMARATTITEQVESLGSYGPTSWRSLAPAGGWLLEGLSVTT
jgi:hypothetical protein